jgi:hypothetical protein
MHIFNRAAGSALLSSFALRAAVDPGVGVWQAPTATDIRGPCPGLNALANHGYLPRDGKKIHVTDIVTAMDQHLGIAVSFPFSFGETDVELMDPRVILVSFKLQALQSVAR